MVALLEAIASLSWALRSWMRFVKIVFTIDGTIDMIFSTEEKRDVKLSERILTDCLPVFHRQQGR